MFTVTDLANDLARKKMGKAPSAVSVGTNTEQGRSYTEGLTTNARNAPTTSGATGLTVNKSPLAGAQSGFAMDSLTSSTTPSIDNQPTSRAINTSPVLPMPNRTPNVSVGNAPSTGALGGGPGYTGGKGGEPPATKWDVTNVNDLRSRTDPNVGNTVAGLGDPPYAQDPELSEDPNAWNLDQQRSDYWDPEARKMMSEWMFTKDGLEDYANQRSAAESDLMDQAARRIMSKQLMQMQSALGSRGMGMSGAAGAMSGDIMKQAAMDRALKGIELRQQARNDALNQQGQMMNKFGQESGDLFQGQFQWSDMQIKEAAEQRKKEAWDRYLDWLEGGGDPNDPAGSRGGSGGGGAGSDYGEGTDAVTGGGGHTAGGIGTKDDFLGVGDESVALKPYAGFATETQTSPGFKAGYGSTGTGLETYGGEEANMDRMIEKAKSATYAGAGAAAPADAQQLDPSSPLWPKSANPDESNVWYDSATNTYYVKGKSDGRGKTAQQKPDLWGSIWQQFGF